MRLSLPANAAIAALLTCAVVAPATASAKVTIPSDVAAVAATISAVAPSTVPEESGSSAYFAAAPGQTLVADVTPNGCQDDSCRYRVSTTNPAPAPQPAAKGLGVVASAAPKSKIAAAAGATVKVLSVTATKAQASALATTSGSIYTIGNQNDQVCSVAGCVFWRMTMGNKAYGDYNLAWGTRSRFGVAGSITCTKAGTGISVNQQACAFVNDPSARDLYANYQANVSGAVKGSPINRDQYLHRHYWADGNSWLVTN